MHLTIAEILEATGGSLINGVSDNWISKVSTDTRKLEKNDFYIVLKGPHFDGHDFIKNAIAKGAMGALVSHNSSFEYPPFFKVITVGDTLKALGDLARFWRRKFTIPVLAITGSSGKTTTKEMIAACLKEKGPVCKTEGNLNNLIGLPLTLFNMEARHHYAVIEMGMNAFGEIARLAEITMPTLGLITNVGRAHLEGVGSVEGVAKAKGELFEAMNAKASVLVNCDDPFIVKMPTKAKKLTYGFAPEAQVRCVKVQPGENDMRVTIQDPNQETEFKLPVTGPHQAANWVASYAACLHLGISPTQAQEGISKFKHSKMRGEEIHLSNNILVINDTYNANPDSMRASLVALKQRFPHKRKIAVLGEMFELGEESDCLHLKVGEEAALQDVFLVMTFGKRGSILAEGFQRKSGSKAYSFESREILVEKLKSLLTADDVVLVKGSRGSKMDEVVELLKS
jgi:UDP-N-acetylmuramoyl-tripeptide--D-alanyl-D-alanine ligase